MHTGHYTLGHLIVDSMAYPFRKSLLEFITDSINR
jgi:hypothetical protein